MTQIKIILAVLGDSLNPQKITEIMGLSPTSHWKKGDQVPNRKTGLLRKETCWEYSFGFIPTVFLEEASKGLIKALEPNLDLLVEYVAANKLEAKLDIVVEVHNGEKPSLFFGKKLLDAVARLNGEIDIDLYLLEQ